MRTSYALGVVFSGFLGRKKRALIGGILSAPGGELLGWWLPQVDVDFESELMSTEWGDDFYTDSIGFTSHKGSFQDLIKKVTSSLSS